MSISLGRSKSHRSPRGKQNDGINGIIWPIALFGSLLSVTTIRSSILAALLWPFHQWCDIWVNSMMLRSVIWVLLAFSGKGMGAILPRDYTADAVCSPGDSWMDNAQHKDPCLTAAYVIGSCVSSSRCLDCTPFYRWRIILTAWKVMMWQPSMAVMDTRLMRPLLIAARGMFFSVIFACSDADPPEL